MKNQIFKISAPLQVVMLVVIFSLAAVSCSLPENLANKASNENKILLEVTTVASETSYPYGRILEFRLYDNRIVEFDFYPPKSANGGRFTPEKKSTKLKEDDYNAILSLLKNPELLDARNFYEPRRISPMSVDSKIRKTIVMTLIDQRKEIILEEYDSYLYLEKVPSYITAKSNQYPPSLIQLLKVVEEINRSLRKEIDPESR